MASYAILGGTGNCGSALIENLLKKPSNKIKVYCRNQLKLQQLLPQIVDNKQVQIFQGSIADTQLIADCIRGTKAVFMVVTSNDNIPGCHLSQDSATSVIEALRIIQAESNLSADFGSDLDASQTLKVPLPKLVLLSSATIDNHLARHMPFWFRPIMLTAASYVYEDLRRAESFLRQQEDWVSTVYIKPGGLSLDVARGHRLSLDEEESFISYLDLSAAMIEAANDPDGSYDGKNVGVLNATRGVGARFPRGTPFCILVGLIRHFFPSLHPYMPSTGPS